MAQQDDSLTVLFATLKTSVSGGSTSSDKHPNRFLNQWRDAPTGHSTVDAAGENRVECPDGHDTERTLLARICHRNNNNNSIMRDAVMAQVRRDTDRKLALVRTRRA